MNWHFIEEIKDYEKSKLMKCSGVVMSISKASNFFTLLISDMTGTAQATMYEDESVYEALILPRLGDSVVILGEGRKKQFKDGANFQILLKLKIQRYKIISINEEFKNYEKTISAKRERITKRQIANPEMKKKVPIFRELMTAVNSLEIRTLVLCCLYLTLESNADIRSFTFTEATIKKHRMTKNFLEQKKLKESCLAYIDDLISKALEYLVEKGVLQSQEVIEGKVMYKFEKKWFLELQIDILTHVNGRRSLGTIISDIVYDLNHHLGFQLEKNFAFNENLVQKILTKLLEEGKIYRTNEKKIYPNF